MDKLEIEAPPGEDISKILDTRRKSWMKSRKFEEQLESDKIQPEVLKEVIKEVEEDEHQTSQIQEVLERILQYTPLQVFLLVLAIIDVAIVVSEILVTLHISDTEKNIMNDALQGYVQSFMKMLHLDEPEYLSTMIQKLNETLANCFQNESSTLIDEQQKTSRISLPQFFYNPELVDRPRRLLRLKRSSDDDSEIPKNGLRKEDVIEQLHTAEKVLNITSIVILGIFVVVAVLKLVAEGRHFFTQIMEIIDSFVVTLSFILDILKYTGTLNKDATEAVIVILLLWQIVRMFNGIMLSELKRLDFRIKLLKRTRRKVESRLSTVTNKMKQMEKEIEGLKRLSRQKGALEEEIRTCRPSSAPIKPSALAGLSCIASMSVGLSISTPLAADLIEQKNSFLQSLSRISKGNSFPSSPNDDLGGMSLVAMFPSETSSFNAMETEESIAEEVVSPTKKVTFDDDDGDCDGVGFDAIGYVGGDCDRDGNYGGEDGECKLDEENNKVSGGARKNLFKRQTSILADDVTSNYDNYDDVFKLSQNCDGDYDDSMSNVSPVCSSFHT